MSRVKPVSGAMSPKGGSRSGSQLAKCCFMTMMVVVLIFFLSMGGSNEDSISTNDNLRSGQAHHHVKNVTARPKMTVTAGNTLQQESAFQDGEEEDEETDVEMLDETIDVANEEISNAEYDEVMQNEDGLLGSALEAMTGVIKSGVSKLLGDDASEAEVEAITEEVEDMLVNETQTEFEQKADEVAMKESDEIDDLVEEGVIEEQGPDIIEERIADAAPEILERVREGVDDVAVSIEANLRDRAVELEKQIMEERLSLKLGKPIKLMIVDGDLQYATPLVPPPPPPPMQQQQQYGQQQPYGYVQPPPPQGYNPYQQQQVPPQYAYNPYQQQPPPPGYPQQQYAYPQQPEQQQPLPGYPQQQPLQAQEAQQPLAQQQQPLTTTSTTPQGLGGGGVMATPPAGGLGADPNPPNAGYESTGEGDEYTTGNEEDEEEQYGDETDDAAGDDALETSKEESEPKGGTWYADTVKGEGDPDANDDNVEDDDDDDADADIGI